MAQYDIPGTDKKLNVPDNLDPITRERLASAIQRKYGIDINQTTVLGQAAEIPKGILRGAAGLAVDVPLGISALLDVGDDGKITKGLQALKKQIREYYQKYGLTFKNDDFKGYFRGNNTIYGIMGKDNKYSRFLFWDNGNKTN